MITDAQVHIWEVDRPDRPWRRTVGTLPPQRPDGWSAEQMLVEMEATGVDRAVIVPPSWIGENNSTALEAAAAHPGRFAVMGRFDPTGPDVGDRLEHWLDQPNMVGIRLTFQNEFVRWLEDDTLDGFWKNCERLGIPVMLLVPGIAGKLRPVAERHPGQTLIIDHLAANTQQRGEDAFAGIDGLLGLGEFPNVRVKVSSAPSFSHEPYPFKDIEPILRRIYDAFGARRLMWGSDITRLTSTYTECLDHFRKGLPFLSADDVEWIIGKTTAETMKWPEGRA
jgi:predicted TIM-barrel fold metal-dependent hydrolase